MIRIRLRRIGKKRQPYYRMVVANQQAKRDGAFLETLGSYNPHASPPLLEIDEEKAREWLGKGAQPSEAAEKILRRAGVLPPAEPVKLGARAAAKQAATVAAREAAKAPPAPKAAAPAPAVAAVVEPPTEEAPAEAAAADEPAPDEAAEPEASAAETPAKEPAE